MFWGRRKPYRPVEPQQKADDLLSPEAAFLSGAEAIRASLGADASVSGRLSFTRPTRIDGSLRGEVRASDALIIGRTGSVDGMVRAARLLVLGRVQGEVIVPELVEIAAGGSLGGRVETRALVVHDGARLDAHCRVTATRATVHVLQPRTASES